MDESKNKEPMDKVCGPVKTLLDALDERVKALEQANASFVALCERIDCLVDAVQNLGDTLLKNKL